MNQMSIEIEIVEAKDLPSADRNGLSDPYVIVRAGPGILTPVKTPVIRKTLNPVWNYKTVLRIEPTVEEIRFEVYDWDRFSRDDPLGYCVFRPSIFNDGVPIDQTEPLIRMDRGGKMMKKQKGDGAPEYKGELHVRMEAKNVCQFCTPGTWFGFQGGAANPSMAQVQPGQAAVLPEAEAPGGFPPICMGLGWDTGIHTFDLDASVVVFDSAMERTEVVFFNHQEGCGGAIVHSGDNRTGEGDGDDEVITIDLGRIPPNVYRLACVVNSYTGRSLAGAKSAFVRLFTRDGRTLGCTALSKMFDSTGLFFCFFERTPQGQWCYQTVLQPVSGVVAYDSTPDIVSILAPISFL